jgi:ankyrin repeat protein
MSASPSIWANAMKSLNESLEAGDVDGVAARLDNGAGIDAIDERTGVTPLMAAVDCQSAALVALLLERGASTDAVDAQGQTALHFAVAAMVDARAYDFDTCGEMREPDIRILRMLLDAGANASATDRNGASAWDWARDGNLTEVAALLALSAHTPERDAADDDLGQ